MAEIGDEEFSSLLNNIYHKHYSKTKFETDITNMQQIAERFIQKITGIVKVGVCVCILTVKLNYLLQIGIHVVSNCSNLRIFILNS